MSLRQLEDELKSKGIPERGVEAASKVLVSIFTYANRPNSKPGLVSLQTIMDDLRSRLHEDITPLYVLDGVNILEANGYVTKSYGVYTLTPNAIDVFKQSQPT